ELTRRPRPPPGAARNRAANDRMAVRSPRGALPRAALRPPRPRLRPPRAAARLLARHPGAGSAPLLSLPPPPELFLPVDPKRHRHHRLPRSHEALLHANSRRQLQLPGYGHEPRRERHTDERGVCGLERDAPLAGARIAQPLWTRSGSQDKTAALHGKQ